MRNDWLRAMCHYGFMPCNGLLYVPPHHCFCYPGVKMKGFLALAGDQQAGDCANDDRSRPRIRQTSLTPGDRARIRPGSCILGASAATGRPTATTPSQRSHQHGRVRRTAARLADATRRQDHARPSSPAASSTSPSRCPPGLLPGRRDAAKSTGISRPEAASIRRRRSTRAWSCSAVATAGSTACGPTDGELVWRFRAAPRGSADRGLRSGRIDLARARQRAGAGRRRLRCRRAVEFPGRRCTCTA